MAQWRHTPRFWFLLLFSAIFVTAQAAAKQDQHLPAVLHRGDSRGRALLVSLANGKLVALDKNTGATLWTFDSGAPLLSSTNQHARIGTASTAHLANSASAPVDTGDWHSGRSVFPGTDGSLYAYLAVDGDSPRIERLPAGVSDLVNQSPVSTLDGNMLLGSQHTSVFFVDSRTGQLIKTVYDFDGELGQLGAATLGVESGLDIELSSLIIIGRKDYDLRSVHPQFGLQWNVTWGQVNRMSELEVHHYGGRDGQGPGVLGAAEALPQHSESRAAAANIRLLVGHDFSLRCVHPGDGWEQWLHRFDAPPLAAYLATSGTNLLAPQRQQRGDMPLAPSAVAPAYAALLPARAGTNTGTSSGTASDAVVLVMQGGSIFGIPTAHLTFDAASETGTAVVATAAGQCQMPRAERLVQDRQLTDGSLVGVLDLDQQQQWTQADGKLSSSQCKPAKTSSDYCAAPMFMLHAVQRHGSSSLLLLPPLANDTTAALTTQQQPEKTLIGSWVVLFAGTALGAMAAIVVAAWSLRTGAVAAQQLATAATASSQPSGVAVSAGTTGSKARRKGNSSKRHQQQMSNRVKGLVKQAALQDSPSSATADAISSGPDLASEREEQVDDTLPSSTAVTAGLMDPTIRVREVKDGVILIGRMRIGPGVLGYGSGGTVVFSGELDGRPVAVKRMLRQFYEMARKEINALILADEHPNIVRCFAMEEDHEFVYLALEKCKATLSDAMQNEAMQHRFIDTDGQPTQFAYQVAADIGNGVAALHERGIVHRDLKPQNVLLTESGRAKLSDMGLSKQLVPEQISFESVGSGGSSGWQAPEQLISRSGGTARQTSSVDVFSFGLLLHYCLTGGQHPFGKLYERDANILHRRLDLKHVQHLPEAVNVIRGCCEPQDPAYRPAMCSVMVHPVWWPAPQRLAFLIAVSDRVEGEDRAEDKAMYQALEWCTQDAIGSGGSWAALMDSGLVNNLGKYRKYSYSSLRDLLRVIRNKHNHFRELPSDLQKKIGPIPEGFLSYFAGRCPGLLMTCYYFALKWCSQEHAFQPYFSAEAGASLDHMAPRSVREPQLPLPDATVGCSSGHQQQGAGSDKAAEGSKGAALDQLLAADAALQAARQASQAARAASAASAAAFAACPPIAGEVLGTLGIMSEEEQQQDNPPEHSIGMPTSSQRSQMPHNRGGHSIMCSTPMPPQQLASPPGSTGCPPRGARLPPSLLLEPSLPECDIAPVSIVQDVHGSMALFPQRYGQPVCDFYQKTGHCRFGEACKFDHPLQYAVHLNPKGLPLRPGQPVCAFYSKTGECKFGASCKWHHPIFTSE